MRSRAASISWNVITRSESCARDALPTELYPCLPMKTSSELVYPAVHPEDAVLLQKYAGMCLLGKFKYDLNRNSSPHWGGRRARDQLTAEKIFPLQSTV